MSTSPDDLLYAYGGIESVSSAIASFVSTMNSELDAVDSRFQGLIAQGWHGTGANAFYTKSQQWHAAANEMAATLQRLSTKVNDAGVQMHQADNQAAARFS
jgi:WXG100 family type VII secretion target